MGQKVIQKIKKVLKINKVSKELRAKIIAEEGELSAIEISNRQTEAFLDAEYNDYDLLVPIAVSNPLRDNFDEVHIWNFDAWSSMITYCIFIINWYIKKINVLILSKRFKAGNEPDGFEQTITNKLERQYLAH